MPDLVLTTFDDPVLTISLNRPEKRNALSLDLIEALRDAVEETHARSAEARVVILAGEGKSFCAGMDLRGVVSDAAAMSKMLLTLAETMIRIRELPVPTIARVQGAAIGGGCGLMVVTDFAISHSEAKLGYPEVDLGVCPAVVAPWLIRKIGVGRARAMLLAGGTISGEEAAACGLVDRLAANLVIETDGLARKLASGGHEALAVTKLWLNRLDGSLDRQTASHAAALSSQVISGEEAQTILRDKLGV